MAGEKIREIQDLLEEVTDLEMDGKWRGQGGEVWKKKGSHSSRPSFWLKQQLEKTHLLNAGCAVSGVLWR